VRRVEEYLDVETEGRSGKGIEVLTAIKLFHTTIWAFLAASILVLPVAGVLRRFATRDPVSGTVYYAMLVAFAIMPLFVAKK